MLGATKCTEVASFFYKNNFIQNLYNMVLITESHTNNTNKSNTPVELIKRPTNIYLVYYTMYI